MPSTFFSTAVSIVLLIVGAIACCYFVWSIAVRGLLDKRAAHLNDFDKKSLRLWFNIYTVGSMGVIAGISYLLRVFHDIPFTYGLTAVLAAGVGAYYVTAGMFVWWNKEAYRQLAKLPAGVPQEHKDKAKASFKDVFERAYILMPIEVSCPFVVAILLLFVKREANELPQWMIIFSSDSSINGNGVAQPSGSIYIDNHASVRTPEGYVNYSDPSYTGDAYYAEGHHPRSWIARYIWLGLRSKGTYLAMKLGVLTPSTETDYEHWGNPQTGRARIGYCLFRVRDHYQLLISKQSWFGLCRRTHVGFKIWGGYHGKQYASLVNVTYSIHTWRTEPAVMEDYKTQF